ncbi:uncharacterized protein LOC111343173 isoform X1 [Stylophora pistillata]|uniref:uncharacterized protein LOC111343173 isoform X1 n=2 Tax=Stylophora pistillata TaxID=50429 RepID=UPI000C03B73D|nr:uncharacterized protein LOC111343173 isoform X1 [Stylophora pistillata]
MPIISGHSSLAVEMADIRDPSWSFKAYTIPRKERRPSEDCQYVLPVNSREAKEIEQSIKRLTWDTNDLVDRVVSISYIKKVDNLVLEREYHEKRASMRDEGRLPKELSQQLAFCVETEDCRVRDICRIGLVCDGVDHTLGDGYMGVTVWRCPDLCLRAFRWPTSGTAYLMVFKIVKGRVKFVSAKLSPEGHTLEPSPNYDCHVSRNTACSSVTDLTALMRSTQYYLYEYDDEGLPSKRPRHCLPFAVIALHRSEEMASLLKSPVCLENVASAVKDSTLPIEDLTPFFNEEDGILAWRGLVTCKDKKLGCVSLLAGHKLGINFWKSYLDVSTKILFKQLGALLPGDVKSAWRSPLDYRNYVLSLCTMRVASRQQSETFTSFTRHLAIKAKAAGVLCIDPSTTMFLVPSGKLAVRLGFCAVAEPLRMFCIVCRRQSPFPPSVCPLTPPTVSRSAQSSPSTPVWPPVSILRPASLDFNVRHKSKIVVSSPSNSLRHSHPRHIAKRSLSFSHSPVRNDSKSLQRTSRSASSSGTVAFQGDIAMDSTMSSDFSNDNVMSTTEEDCLKNQSRMPDADSKGNEINSANSLKGRSCNSLDVEHLESNPEYSTVSCASFDTVKSSKPKLAVLNLSRLKTLRRLRNVSTNAQNGNSESIIQSNGSTNSKSSRTPNERPHTPTTSTNFFPFWPDSPLVLFPDRERIPFLSDTPVKTIQAEDTREAISESPREDFRTDLSKPGGESFKAA